jgi:hypothetical protein
MRLKGRKKNFRDFLLRLYMYTLKTQLLKLIGEQSTGGVSVDDDDSGAMQCLSPISKARNVSSYFLARQQLSAQ